MTLYFIGGGGFTIILDLEFLGRLLCQYEPNSKSVGTIYNKRKISCEAIYNIFEKDGSTGKNKNSAIYVCKFIDDVSRNISFKESFDNNLSNLQSNSFKLSMSTLISSMQRQTIS